MVKTLGRVRPMHSNPLHALHLLTVYTVNKVQYLFKCTQRKLVLSFGHVNVTSFTRWSLQCIRIYIKLHRFHHFYARQSIRYRNEARARMKGPYGTGEDLYVSDVTDYLSISSQFQDPCPILCVLYRVMTQAADRRQNHQNCTTTLPCSSTYAVLEMLQDFERENWDTFTKL